MTSFGLFEIFIVVVLILISFDVKQIGKILKVMRTWRTKFYRMQSDLRYQFNNLLEEEEDKERQSEHKAYNASQRRNIAVQINRLSPELISGAARSLPSQLEKLQGYAEAKTLAAYASLPDELDTSHMLKKILSDGKTLLLPYVIKKEMFFAKIRNLEKQLAKGAFGIPEPMEEYRKPAELQPDILLIPGRCFDEAGGRIGRGGGYYDKFLASCGGVRAGLCYDVQVSKPPLQLQYHDQRMDYILTEKRLIDAKQNFSNGIEESAYPG